MPAVGQTAPPLSDEQLKSANTYTDLDEANKYPLQVYKLDLSAQELEEVPEDLFRYQNLQYLNLSHNELDSLPRRIGELGNLQILYLFRNNLRSLPESIGNLKHLEYLYLGKNRLHMFPMRIRFLESLKLLDITFNHFTTYEMDYVHRHLPDCEIRY